MVRFAAASLALATLMSANSALLAETALQSPAPAGDPQKRLELAQGIIDLGVPEATREAMFFKVVDQMTAQMREASLGKLTAEEPEAVAILDAWLEDWTSGGKVTLRKHIPALMAAWAAAYADIYTEQELTDIKAFVATPSGAAFFQRMQDVLGNPKFASANQAYMNEVMAGLPAAQQELMAKLQAHYAKKRAAK